MCTGFHGCAVRERVGTITLIDEDDERQHEMTTTWARRSEPRLDHREPRHARHRVAVLLVAAMVLLLAGPRPADAANQTAPPFETSWTVGDAGPGARGVAVDLLGNVYVIDSDDAMVRKYSPNGGELASWGGFGTGNGQFQDPAYVTVDDSNFVYVTDFELGRVQKFTDDGAFVAKWGSFGTGNGRFDVPGGVAVNSFQEVYVVDYGNDRVQRFTSNGTFISKWGTFGTGNGQFKGVIDIAVDGHNNVYVTDQENHRVQVFDRSGTFLRKWTAGQTPSSIDVDTSGDVYVLDESTDRVQKYRPTGTLITRWGSAGTGNGQFDFAWDLAVDGDNNVYVTDEPLDRVQRFGFGTGPLPDGRIKLGTGTLKGDNIYNDTGAGQTSNGSAARGASVTYTVSIQNDAPSATTLTVAGTATTNEFKIKYVVGTTDVTSQVVAGTYTTPLLTPGGDQAMKVVVTVRSAAPAHAVLPGLVTLTSGARADTVKFVTTRA